ncbi:hypothetical protein KR200_003121, partial [Drosophila serrata]
MLDYIFNILIVGDVGVGKSSLLNRFMEDQFTDSYNENTGVELKTYQVEIAKKSVLLHMLDIPGEERFRAMLQIHYPKCHGVIIVYDTTSLSSFHQVSSWVQELRDYCGNEVKLMLVGTKCDEMEKRQVTGPMAFLYAEGRGLTFFEASAKSGKNVTNIFHTFAGEAYYSLVYRKGN